MTANAAHRLMLFLRLVLVASLTGYMLPTVSYAMHGDVAASYIQETVASDVPAAHLHDETAAVYDHGDQTADHHENGSNQDCCSNFCLNLAVVHETLQFSAAKASITRSHTNDQRVFAEPIRLNRPPASRT